MGRDLRMDKKADLQSETMQTSTAKLLGDIIADGQKLVRQEITLARVEIQQEWDKAKSATKVFSIAIGMALVAVFLAALTFVELLVAAGVPPWLSYLIAAVVLGGASASLIRRGRVTTKKIDFVPRQTVETMRENVQWIRSQR